MRDWAQVDPEITQAGVSDTHGTHSCYTASSPQINVHDLMRRSL